MNGNKPWPVQFTCLASLLVGLLLAASQTGLLIGIFIYSYWITIFPVCFRIGRRLAFTLNVLALASATTGLAFSPNIIAFCILRFLCGFFAVGHFLILFVWGNTHNDMFEMQTNIFDYISPSFQVSKPSVGNTVLCAVSFINWSLLLVLHYLD